MTDIKVLSSHPKYPPVEDGGRTCYLVLHVGIPSRVPIAPSTKHLRGLRSARAAAKELGIKVWPQRVVWPPEYWGEDHGPYMYFFRFPWWTRDDVQALRIAESFLYGVSLTFGPLVDQDETWPVLRVPAGLARDAEAVPVEKLVQLEEARSFEERTLPFPRKTLIRALYVSEYRVDAAWRITPILVRDDALHRAARFLKASQDDFYVWPGQIPEALGDQDASARTGPEQTSLERALQDAFKAVESVLGDPPKDDRKFFSKIKSIGLDPEEQMGYTRKLPLHRVLRRMNMARDKRAAHGSTPHRTITVGEMMTYQHCAYLILMAAVESRLGEPV